MPAQNIASYFMFPVRVFVHILFINSSGNNDLSDKQPQIRIKFFSYDETTVNPDYGLTDLIYSKSDFGLDGYTLLGVCGFNTGNRFITICSTRISNDTIYLSLINGSDTVRTATPSIWILYY